MVSAAAGLADRDDLARPHFQADVIDDAGGAAPGRDIDPQIVDRQARRPVRPAMGARHGRPTRADAGRGSHADRRPEG
jgi:hypothetical protein